MLSTFRLEPRAETVTEASWLSTEATNPLSASKIWIEDILQLFGTGGIASPKKGLCESAMYNVATSESLSNISNDNLSDL